MKGGIVRRRAVACLVVALSVLCCVLIAFAFFYARANEGYPAHGIVRYDDTSLVALRSIGESGDAEANPEVTLKVEGAAMLSADEFMAEFPDYTDRMLSAGQAQDARFVIVQATVENASENDARTLLDGATIQTGSYANGIEYSLYQMLNGAQASFTFKAHSSSRVYLPYAIYDASFGFNTTWNSIDESSFELVTALYPDKEYIDLGVLGNTSLSDLSLKG